MAFFLARALAGSPPSLAVRALGIIEFRDCNQLFKKRKKKKIAKQKTGVAQNVILSVSVSVSGFDLGFD